MVTGRGYWFDKEYHSLKLKEKIVSTVCDAGQRQIHSSKTGQFHYVVKSIIFIGNQIYIWYTFNHTVYRGW